MKKIIAAFLITGCSLFQSNISAQTSKMPVDEVTKLVTYTDVVEEKGMNADTLFNRALRWFPTFYKNPKDAIKSSDAATKTIEAGYRFKIEIPDPAVTKPPVPMVNVGTVNYKLKIMCKDNKFKYELTNFAWQQTSYYPIERWMDKDAKNYNPAFEAYLAEVDKYAKELIRSLETFIETEPLKKSEDW
jgi:hypothetical protein